MNCCDYNCGQGRNCPVRVAKIGRKHHDKEALPPSTMPRRFKHLAKWMLICIAALLAIAALGVAYA